MAPACTTGSPLVRPERPDDLLVNLRATTRHFGEAPRCTGEISRRTRGKNLKAPLKRTHVAAGCQGLHREVSNLCVTVSQKGAKAADLLFRQLPIKQKEGPEDSVFGITTPEHGGQGASSHLPPLRMSRIFLAVPPAISR
jgi:hypothetical protein